MSFQPGVSSTIDANPAPFFQVLDRILHGTNQTFSQVGDSIGSIAGPIGTVMSRLNAVAALLGGGAVFKKAITETVELTQESMAIGRVLGANAQTGSTWITALDDVNSSTEELSAASKGLLRNLKENEKGLNDMGLVTRDASGNLRSMDQIMLDAIETVNTYKEGTDRNLAAQQIFGKGVDGTSQILLLNSETIAQNAQLQEELGLVVGEANVEAYKKYDAAMDAANVVIKTVWTTIGQLLMPVLTQLATWFRDIAPAAILVLKGALGGIVTALHGIIFVINVIWETFAMAFKSMTAIGRGFADTMSALFRGDFEGAKRAATGVYSDLQKLDADYRASIVRQAEQTRDNIAAIWGLSSPDAPAAEVASEGKSYKKPDKEKKVQDDSLQHALNSSKIRLEMVMKEYAESVKYLDELTAREDSAAAHKRELALQQIEAHADLLRIMADNGDISRAEELAGLQRLEDQRYQVERQALQRRLDDLNLEKIERQKAAQDMELLQVDHDRRMTELLGQQQTLRKQNWMDLFSGMQGGFQGVLSQFGRGALSLNNLWKGLMSSMLDAVTNTLASIAARWMTLKIMSLVFNKSAIAGEAAKAGAGGTASMAAAPFPLNLTAPGFGAAMSALAASYLAIPAAAQGFDIPAGLNPLTQLHQREMVLPENLADVVRGMAERGVSGGGSLELKVVRAGPGELFVRERDLVATLKKLAGQNYR